MPVRRTVARNYAEASENRIHSDDVARRFGFSGALVPGVTVFGHLAAPLTERYGVDWLGRSWARTRFIRPAYDGETITVTDQETETAHLCVEARNASDTLLATLECSLSAPQPPPDPRAGLTGSGEPFHRVEMTWETVEVDEPFTSYRWQPDDAHNREYAARVNDDSAVFRDGVLHPHALLSQANQVLVRRFIMPAWIHTESEIRFRRLLRVGDEIDVRAVPMERYERKGHHFIKLYIAYVVGTEVATEILHTAIFRVAER